MNKYKSILISEELHKQLKVYAVQHGNSVKNIVEGAIGNMISQKSSSVRPDGSPTTLKQNSVEPLKKVVEELGEQVEVKEIPQGSLDKRKSVLFE